MAATTPGCMKLNVDAAISKNLGRATVAAVARDQAGNFLGASGVVMDGLTDVETDEVIAWREGLALASDLMLRSSRLASDSANVIIRSVGGARMYLYGQFVKEIKASVLGFLYVDFAHESRKSNVHAHNLARSMFFETGRHVRLLEPHVGVCNSYDQLHE